MKRYTIGLITLLVIVGCEKELEYSVEIDGIKYNQNSLVEIDGILYNTLKKPASGLYSVGPPLNASNGSIFTESTRGEEIERKTGFYYLGKIKDGKKEGRWTYTGNNSITFETDSPPVGVYTPEDSYTNELYYKDGILIDPETKELFTGEFSDTIFIFSSWDWESRKSKGSIPGDGIKVEELKTIVVIEGNYKDGKKDGEWTKWYKGVAGRQRNLDEWKFSEIDWKKKKIIEGNYKDGKKDGEWVYHGGYNNNKLPSFPNLYYPVGRFSGEEPPFGFGSFGAVENVTKEIRDEEDWRVKYYKSREFPHWIEGNYKDGEKDGVWSEYMTSSNYNYFDEMDHVYGSISIWDSWLYRFQEFWNGDDEPSLEKTKSFLFPEREKGLRFSGYDPDSYSWKKDEHYEYHPYISKIAEGNYKDGKKDGVWTEWYPFVLNYNNSFKIESVNSKKWEKLNPSLTLKYPVDVPLNTDILQKKRKENYKDGKRVGLSNGWYENGNKANERTYNDDGQPYGKWTYWYKNGNKANERTYNDDGQPYGKWTSWHENGQKAVEGTYIDNSDQKDIDNVFGEYGYYLGLFRKGMINKTGIWTYWYENGQKAWEADYKGDNYYMVDMHHHQKRLNDPVSFKDAVPYLDEYNLLTETWTTWWPNGQKMIETSIKEDGETAKWLYFNEDGKKILEYDLKLKEYKPNYKLSELSDSKYHPNYLIPNHLLIFKQILDIENGKTPEETGKLWVRDGLWTQWWEYGVPQHKAVEGTYKAGEVGEGTYSPYEKNGKWTYWYGNGQKRNSYTLVDGKRTDGPDTTWLYYGWINTIKIWEDGEVEKSFVQYEQSDEFYGMNYGSEKDGRNKQNPSGRITSLTICDCDGNYGSLSTSQKRECDKMTDGLSSFEIQQLLLLEQCD